MGFYEEIADYYDEIFPTGKEQIEFIRKSAGKPPKTLLDIACGTGGYALALDKLGYVVTATDVDTAMIQALKNKQTNQDHINSIQVGMLQLKEILQERFDLAFCIGNSIVHLNGLEEIREFFKIAKEILTNEGSLLLQIINFDRVLIKGITELPPIKNDEIGLTFERFYRFDQEKNLIYFKTILTVKDKKIENEIPLFPLLREDAVNILNDVGFKKVKLFGDFNGSEYNEENSYMLVLLASL